MIYYLTINWKLSESKNGESFTYEKTQDFSYKKEDFLQVM